MSKHHPLDVRYNGGAAPPLPPSLRKRAPGEEKPATDGAKPPAANLQATETVTGMPKVGREGQSRAQSAVVATQTTVTRKSQPTQTSESTSAAPRRGLRLWFLFLVGAAIYGFLNFNEPTRIDTPVFSQDPAAPLSPEEIKAQQKP